MKSLSKFEAINISILTFCDVLELYLKVCGVMEEHSNLALCVVVEGGGMCDC